MNVVSKAHVRTPPRPISKQRLRLWLRLLRSSRAIESQLRERLRTRFSITLPQFDVMAALARSDEGRRDGRLVADSDVHARRFVRLRRHFSWLCSRRGVVGNAEPRCWRHAATGRNCMVRDRAGEREPQFL